MQQVYNCIYWQLLFFLECAEYAESAGSALKEFDACTSMDNLEVIAAAFPTEFPHMVRKLMLVYPTIVNNE